MFLFEYFHRSDLDTKNFAFIFSRVCCAVIVLLCGFQKCLSHGVLPVKLPLPLEGEDGRSRSQSTMKIKKKAVHMHLK